MSYEDVINNGIGLVTGTAVAIQFPSHGVQLVRFKADPSNPANSFLGTTASHMWPLAAGDDTGWVLADDLSDYWYKGTGTAAPNLIHFWVQ
jgi:hypothetical protein